ncbi:MAG: hypothetical protein QME77_13685, partial [bacterium]|nr:hypothetical protein [bacterium]
IGPIPSRVEYSASGHLLYVQDGTLMARPFDEANARFTGGPFPVAEGALASDDAAHVSVSNTGAIAYGVSATAGRSVLAWVDRSGRTLAQVGEPDAYGNPALSPDGTRVAYDPSLTVPRRTRPCTNGLRGQRRSLPPGFRPGRRGGR